MSIIVKLPVPLSNISFVINKKLPTRVSICFIHMFAPGYFTIILPLRQLVLNFVLPNFKIGPNPDWFSAEKINIQRTAISLCIPSKFINLASLTLQACTLNPSW
jgi:hypothetical protein